MIVLLSRDVVTGEMLEWAVRRTAYLLRINWTSIRAQWQHNDRGLCDAEFTVDTTDNPGLSAASIQEALRRVWTLEGKPLLNQRLAGLGQRR